jgi:hypothetical protein
MFDRGIKNGKFVDALKKWEHWEKIISDEELFVAIRKEYINIYFQGCSLFKVSYKEGLVLETHYKYLISPEMKNPYVSWVGNSPPVKDLANQILIDTFDIGSIEKSACPYAKPEKVGLHKILRCNRNVIDLEIALSPESDDEADIAEKSAEGTPAAARVDFAAIQRRQDGKPCIVFFEAKRFDNGELRSETPNPAVIEQTERYREFIEKDLPDIKTSYGIVCKNLVDLGLKRIDPLVVEVAGNPGQLEVVPDVRLVVFDFDQDQKEGRVWKKHKAKLHDYFKDRLLLKGSPDEFTSGISNYSPKVAA